VPFVLRSCRIIDLQIEDIASDDAEEDPALVEADAAKHPSRGHVPEVFQLIQHELPESRRHRQGVPFPGCAV
jgi:hypothetical protein